MLFNSFFIWIWSEIYVLLISSNTYICKKNFEEGFFNLNKNNRVAYGVHFFTPFFLYHAFIWHFNLYEVYLS